MQGEASIAWIAFSRLGHCEERLHAFLGGIAEHGSALRLTLAPTWSGLWCSVAWQQRAEDGLQLFSPPAGQCVRPVATFEQGFEVFA